MRWCSSSRISFCSLSDASRSLASMPALASRAAGIDLGLRKEKPQADILCRQKVLMWFCAAPRAMVCTEIVFRHPQLYHYELAAALIFGGL